MKINIISKILVIIAFLSPITGCYSQSGQSVINQSEQQATNGGWYTKVLEVLDGDDIIVEYQGGKGDEIRLFGIECPEKNQPNWMKAKNFTSDRVQGKTVRIIPVGIRFGKTIAKVYFEKKYLNEELLCAGLARQLTPKSFSECEQENMQMPAQGETDSGQEKHVNIKNKSEERKYQESSKKSSAHEPPQKTMDLPTAPESIPKGQKQPDKTEASKYIKFKESSRKAKNHGQIQESTDMSAARETLFWYHKWIITGKPYYFHKYREARRKELGH